LASLAKAIPKNGWIVEIGSFYGRSAYSLGMNKHPSVLLTAIDPVPSFPHDTDYGYGMRDIPYSIHHFNQFTQSIENFELIRAYTPVMSKNINFQFKKPIDLLHIDGSHLYEDVKSDLEIWGSMVTGSIVCDDYFIRDGVKKAVDEYANHNNLKISFMPRTKSVQKNMYAVLEKDKKG
jgi:hypothetical protein